MSCIFNNKLEQRGLPPLRRMADQAWPVPEEAKKIDNFVI